MNRVASTLGFNPPPWDFVGGNTSFFDHDTQKISFARPVIDFLIRTRDAVDFDGLIAHEVRHAWQFANRFHPREDNLRELDARIYAGNYVAAKWPGRYAEFNFQPIDCSLLGPLSRNGKDKQDIPERLLLRMEDLNTRQQILFSEAFKPQGRPVSTSRFIRARLSLVGDAHIWGMWREMSDILTTLGFRQTLYHSFQGMIYILKRLGFIVGVRREESDFGEDRKFFELVPEFEEDLRWDNPFKAFR